MQLVDDDGAGGCGVPPMALAPKEIIELYYTMMVPFPFYSPVDHDVTCYADKPTTQTFESIYEPLRGVPISPRAMSCWLRGRTMAPRSHTLPPLQTHLTYQRC
jgi:hypothetical protein